jgi:hypothetical protein
MDQTRGERARALRRVSCGATLHLAQRGPYLWEDLDAGLIADALGRMADRGLELLRLPLVWESFQPRPGRVEPSALRGLVEVLDRAASAGLAVLPWLFVGPWMGLAFLPPWTVGPAGRGGLAGYSGGRRRELAPLDLWSDAELLEAQRRLILEVVGAAAGHPAVWGWEVASAPERAFGPAPLGRRASWIRRHAELLAERAEGTMVGASLDAEEAATLGPEIAASVSWIGIGSVSGGPAWAEGLLDPAALPFLASLLRWLSGRRAVLHGLGQPARPATDEPLAQDLEALPSEQETARHAERLLELVPLEDVEAVVAEVWADAGPRLRGLPPYDRQQAEGLRGLVRADGSAKPALGVLERWAMATEGRRRADEPDEEPAAGLSAEQLMAALGVPEPPRPRTSSLLALPGGEEFEALAQDLGLKERRLPAADRRRGAAPAWADVEPEEVENDPATAVPRLYRRFKKRVMSDER